MFKEDFCLDNGYPEYLVQRFVKPKSDTLDKPLQQVEEGLTHKNVTIRLPWIGRISSSFGNPQHNHKRIS